MANTIDDLIQTGLKTHKLAVRERTVLEPRLAAGTIDGLVVDLSSLGASVPNQIGARRASKESTVTQVVALQNVAAILSAIRQAVKAHDAPADARAAYGVGGKVNPKSPKLVFAAVAGVLRAAAADPASARAYGVMDSDIAALTNAAAIAQSADTDQDDQRASAPVATKQRNAAAKNVTSAIKRIATAGALHYATDPKKRAEFEALLASEGRPKRPTKEAKPTA